MRPLAISGILVVLAMAGCVDGPDADVLQEEDHEHGAAAQETLRIEAKNCRSGGGNSVYSMEDGTTKVGPFLAEDQNSEVGDPMIGAFGEPVTGPSNGIWHVATICESYTYMGQEHQGFGMGWIAQMIKRPEFDTWGDPRIQFIVADLSFTDTAFVDAMHEATGGAEISPSLETTIEWVAPEKKYMHVIISEANHGTFDFTAELHKEFGTKESEHFRFWMLPAADGSSHDHEGLEGAEPEWAYRPIAIDIYDNVTGSGTPKLAGESIGTFTHLPDGHVGNPLGHYQDGFDRTIVIGPTPQGIGFNETWLH
jgi:hypothetical protein